MYHCLLTAFITVFLYIALYVGMAMGPVSFLMVALLSLEDMENHQ